MNGTWKVIATVITVALTVALAVASAAYGYGALAGDVAHNAQAIGKNEAVLHEMRRTYQRQIEQNTRDLAVTRQKMENIESGIAEVLREVRKGNGP